MKRPLFPSVSAALALIPLLCLTMAAPVVSWAQDYTVAETSTEFLAAVELNGDGLPDVLLVDKESGNFRVSLGTTNTGTQTWLEARPTGIRPVTGFSFGPLRMASAGSSVIPVGATNRDDIAVTGPSDNRVHVVDGQSFLLSAAFPVGIGPDWVVAVDVPGPDNTPMLDLVVGSGRNNPPAGRWVERLRNAADSLTPIGSAPDAGARRYLRRMRPVDGSTETRILAQHEVAAGTVLELLRVTPAGVVVDAGSGPLPAGSELAWGWFGNAGRASVLTWVPGQGTVRVWTVSEPSPGDFELPNSPTRQFQFGTNAVAGLSVVDGPAGRHQWVVFLNQGDEAYVYDFDGVNPPTLTSTNAIGSLPDEHYNHALSLGPGRIRLMSNLDRVPGRSTVSRLAVWDGTNYVLRASFTMPLGTTLLSPATVAQFRREPFVNAEPGLLALDRAGNWASAPVLTPGTGGLPGVLSVSAETLRGGRGLGNTNLVTLEAHPATAAVLTSQVRDTISLLSMDPALGPMVSEVSATPAAGTHDAAVQVSLRASSSSDRIRWRLDAGPWSAFTAPIGVERSSTLEAYAETADGSQRSRIAAFRYEIGTAWSLQDSDGDGVPDRVESARGLDPRGGADSDGDGSTDLDEILSGTDPASPASRPASGHAPWSWVRPVILEVVPQPHLIVLPGFGPADGTPVSVHALDGLEIATRDTTNSVPGSVAGRARFELESGTGGLVALSTPTDFLASPERPLAVAPSGRELVGLFALPSVPVAPLAVALPDSATPEAWIAAARSWLTTNAGPRFEAVLTPVDVLVAALAERKIDELLPTNQWPRTAPVGLFPHRVGDVGRTNPPATVLASLSAPGRTPQWNLAQMVADLRRAVDAGIDRDSLDLRLLAAEAYRVATYSNNVVVATASGSIRPTTFGPLLDVLRRLVAGEAMDSAYGGVASVTNLVPGAAAAARRILDGLQARPTSSLELVWTGETDAPGCTVLRTASGEAVALLDDRWEAYRLSVPVGIPAGTRLRVVGHEDVPVSGCAPRAIEVVSVGVAGFPVVAGVDEDGNGLPDAWERFFFFAAGAADPYQDRDRDGFYNLQEYAAGTDPTLASSRPTGMAPGAGLAVHGLRMEPGPSSDGRYFDHGTGGASVAAGGKESVLFHVEAGQAEGMMVGFGPSPDPENIPDRQPVPSALRALGVSAGRTNQELVRVDLRESAEWPFLQSVAFSTVGQGSRSNRVVLLDLQGLVLGQFWATNGYRIPMAFQDDLASTEESLGSGKRKAAGGAAKSLLGHLVSKVTTTVFSAASGAAEAAVGAGKKAAGAAMDVADAAAEAAGNALNGGDGDGADDGGDGDGEASSGSDLKAVRLPGGEVVPGVATIVVLPADPTVETTAVERMEFSTTSYGAFNLRDAGLVRGGLVYGARGPVRISGLGMDEGAPLSLGRYDGFELGKSAAVEGFEVQHGADLERVFEALVEGVPGAPRSVPSLGVPAADPRVEPVTVGIRGQVPAGAVRLGWTLSGTNADVWLATAAQGLGIGNLEIEAADGCRWETPAADGLRLRGAGRLVAFQPVVPELGSRAFQLQAFLEWDAPMSLVDASGAVRCSGSRIRLTAVLAEPAWFLGEPPRAFWESDTLGRELASVVPGVPKDFGDAPVPVPAGQTAAAHRIVTALRLGDRLDAEPQAMTDASALGDDRDGFDDEDGVEVSSGLRPGGGAEVRVRVYAPPGGAWLDAFADWNQDRDWEDAGERLATSRAVTNGWNSWTFTVPAGASNGVCFVRFRLGSVGGLGPFGEAADGEVEDHRWRIGVPSPAPRVATLRPGTATGAGAVVVVDSQPGEIVTVESSTRLDGEAWEPEGRPQAATAGQTSVQADAVTTRQRFYRVRVE